MLQHYEEPDGYRVALGDLTRLQKQRLREAYMGLERIRQRRGRHLPTPNAPAHPPSGSHLGGPPPHARPLCSSLVRRAPKRIKSGVYADYNLAKSQILHLPGGKPRGFPDAAAAGGADQLRLALEDQRQRDHVHAKGTALSSIYTDGSYSKAEPSLYTPSKA